MHGNFEVVDIAACSAFFAQARQSRPGEVTWKLERCSRLQFRPDEKCFAKMRSASPRREGSLTQARV